MAGMEKRSGVRTLVVALAVTSVVLGGVVLARPVVAEGDLGREVRFVIDGDTPEVTPDIAGARPVRLLNIDTPEIGGDTQEPWATAARQHLRALMPSGTRVAVRTDAVLRTQGLEATKLVGDWFTGRYVAPEDYERVHVNNRVYFWNEVHAENAGFSPCPADDRGTYDDSCFAAG